jgi:hypothetical protein
MRLGKKIYSAQALARVRERIEERQFQVFDLCVAKGWPAADVAQTFGISVARVYHRARVARVLRCNGNSRWAGEKVSRRATDAMAGFQFPPHFPLSTQLGVPVAPGGGKIPKLKEFI